MEHDSAAHDNQPTGTPEVASSALTIYGAYRDPDQVLAPTWSTAEILAEPPVERRGPSDDDIAGAFAGNTKRAYAADWRLWSAWCRSRDRVALPADPADVADYVKERVAAGRALNSQRRLISAIAVAHKLRGLRFDRADLALSMAMRRLTRELGVAPPHAKAALLTPDIVALLPKGDRLLDVRDRALLLVGFAGGFRRSELVALEVADADLRRRDGMTLRVCRSKTDQDGKGELVGILYGKRERTCPVRALKAWLARAGIAEGLIFREVRGSHVSAAPLDGSAVWRAVKRHAARAGLDPAPFGGHSLRSGCVTQSLENGADPVAAKKQLRHRKLDTTLGYDRGAGSLKRDNVSGKLGL